MLVKADEQRCRMANPREWHQSRWSNRHSSLGNRLDDAIFNRRKFTFLSSIRTNLNKIPILADQHSISAVRKSCNNVLGFIFDEMNSRSWFELQIRSEMAGCKLNFYSESKESIVFVPTAEEMTLRQSAGWRMGVSFASFFFLAANGALNKKRHSGRRLYQLALMRFFCPH